MLFNSSLITAFVTEYLSSQQTAYEVIQTFMIQYN